MSISQSFLCEWLIQTSIDFSMIFSFQQIFINFSWNSKILKQIRISMIFQELREPWVWEARKDNNERQQMVDRAHICWNVLQCTLDISQSVFLEDLMKDTP